MDNKPKIENGIKTYFHCRTCLEKGVKDKVAVGWTQKGIQVWCDQCDTNIVALDFMGNKVGIDTDPDNSKTFY